MHFTIFFDLTYKQWTDCNMHKHNNFMAYDESNIENVFVLSFQHLHFL